MGDIEALCAACGISAARVISRTVDGIVAVPSDIARPGHLMVVSAIHASSFSELTAEQTRSFMTLVAETAASVEKTTGAERCYVIRIGDKAPHLHFHLVPKMAGDPSLAPFVFGEHGWGSATSP